MNPCILHTSLLPTLVLGCVMAWTTGMACSQNVSRLHEDGTTHWYEAVAVPAGITFGAAQLAAHAAGASLATITSSSENDFLFSTIDDPRFWSGDQGPWIGGVQWPGSAEPAGGWAWSELEPLAYQNFAAGKPDNANGADRLHFGGGTGRVRTWSDAPAATLLRGYVIEWSGPTVKRTVGLMRQESGPPDGYTLIAPLNVSDTYLLDSRGRVVNRWSSSYRPGSSAYLLSNGNLMRAGDLRNPNFTNGGSGGIIEEYDWDTNLVWSFQYSSTTVCQHHDFEPLPNGNVLILAWELKTQQEAIDAGRDPALLHDPMLYPDKIIEVQPTGPTTGQIVWEWHAFDHLIQDFDPTKANFGPVTQHPERIDINYPPHGRVGSASRDWMHGNSIHYNAALDQIVLSVRHFNELWVIDHSTTTAEARTSSGGRSGRGGNLLYRYGNPEAYRAGTANDRLFFQQHDAQWIEDGLSGTGNFLVFDNGVERPGTLYSTVMEITPPTPDSNGNYPRPGQAWGPAQPTWTYQAPDPASFYSRFVGGVQRLPNGNTLICSGWQGHGFEVTPAGQIEWSYVNPVNGAAILQGEEPLNNTMFRTIRYPANYPAFVGRNLTPGNPLELHRTVLLVDGSTVLQRAGVGSPVRLSLRSSQDAGKIFLLGTSATDGFVPVDFRYLRVGLDSLLMASWTQVAQTVFQGYLGLLDTSGRAEATLAIPALPILTGLNLYSAFVVVDPIAPARVGTMSNQVVVRIE